MLSKRQRRLAAEKLLKQPETKFERIDLATRSFIPKRMTRAYCNNRYHVMVYDNVPTALSRQLADHLHNKGV